MFAPEFWNGVFAALGVEFLMLVVAVIFYNKK